MSGVLQSGAGATTGTVVHRARLLKQSGRPAGRPDLKPEIFSDTFNRPHLQGRRRIAVMRRLK